MRQATQRKNTLSPGIAAAVKHWVPVDEGIFGGDPWRIR